MFSILKKTSPTQEIFQRNEYTPDMWQLAQSKYQLLFVYDELMLNRRLYKELVNEFSIRMAVGFTDNPSFTMWKQRVGEMSFPIALNSNFNQGPAEWYSSSQKLNEMRAKDKYELPIGRIKGDLFLTESNQFPNLDKHYLNRVQFSRALVKVVIPYRKQVGSVGVDHHEFLHKVRAWMYIGVPEYWKDLLDGGFLFRPVMSYSPGNRWVDGVEMGKYYYYSRKEYDTNF